MRSIERTFVSKWEADEYERFILGNISKSPDIEDQYVKGFRLSRLAFHVPVFHLSQTDQDELLRNEQSCVDKLASERAKHIFFYKSRLEDEVGSLKKDELYARWEYIKNNLDYDEIATARAIIHRQIDLIVKKASDESLASLTYDNLHTEQDRLRQWNEELSNREKTLEIEQEILQEEKAALASIPNILEFKEYRSALKKIGNLEELIQQLIENHNVEIFSMRKSHGDELEAANNEIKRLIKELKKNDNALFSVAAELSGIQPLKKNGR